MPKTLSTYKIILCDYINPVDDKSCEFIRNGAMVLKNSSIGYKIVEKGPSAKILKSYAAKITKDQIEVVEYVGQMALPGFFDMHFHWVQDEVRLKPKASLLEWLSKYTWPYEAKFKDRSYSKKRAKSFAQELLSVGTLGGAAYASIHGHTVDHALKEFVGDYIVGNVLMTMNSPDYLSQTKAHAIKTVEAKSKKYKSSYAMTPRFAPTTHPEVMQDCAKVAKRNKSFIQTHLSETKEEIEYVLSLYKEHKGFEEVESYTEIYRKCGMLGRRTIMGHGIYLSPKELELLRKSNTAIAHCPSSNAAIKDLGLGSGLFDFRAVEKKNISWALASDIGGGPFLSMFDVMRSFVKQNLRKKISAATYTKALYRATLSGAKILGLGKTHGNFDKGKLANFMLVDSPKFKQGDRAEDILKRLIERRPLKREAYQNIVNKTFYAGKEVFIKT